jgi:heme/copper-type cytochrome/quinol oxidase subunit 2
LNNAIIFLLIIVGLVQAGFVALFWSFRKRAKALQQRREQFRVIEGGV